MARVPLTAPAHLPRTLGALRASEYGAPHSVKTEIRDNLLAALRAGRDPWPGILGFESTVLPQLERALIAGHDVVLLGERGQGKTRLLRALAGLLDEWTPVIAGSELGEHPLRPDHAAVPPPGRRAGRRPARRLAAPQRALHREARHPGHRGRRPHRRRRPGQGRRGPLARRPGDDPLRAGPAGAPRHRGDQRAARPRRTHPGLAAQRDGGARHPGPRLHAAAAAGRAAGGQREPRGLHEPRPDHHPAQGPVRRGGAHPLPAGARRRDGGHGPGGRPRRPRSRCSCWRSSPGSPGRCASRARSTRAPGCRRGSPSPRPRPSPPRRCAGPRSPGSRTRRPGRSTSSRCRTCCAASWSSPPARRAGRPRCSTHLLRRATADTARARLRGLDLDPAGRGGVAVAGAHGGAGAGRRRRVRPAPGGRADRRRPAARRGRHRGPGPDGLGGRAGAGVLFLTRKLAKDESDDETVTYG